MFRNNGTGTTAITSSDTSLAAKGEDTTATAEPDLDNRANEKPSSAEMDSINSKMATPPKNTNTAAASGKSTTRSPSRIPRVIKQQRRSRITMSSTSHRLGLRPDKLNSLQASFSDG